MPETYDVILADMVAVARDAGALTLRHFRRFRDLEIGIKGPADFVSDADRESEQLIRKFLFSRYPDWSFTGEEFPPVDGADREYRWLVDPIDGTTNFINGQHYTISIALRRGNETVCGALYNPVADEMFTAIRGRGSFLNGERLTVSAKTDVGLMAVGTGLPTSNLFTFPGFYSRLEKVRAPIGAVRIVGSSANSCAYVACGRLTGYFEESGLVDWAVGVLLVQEAGGTVTDWWGRGPEFYEKTGCVIVANRATHAYLLDKLKDAPMKNDKHKKAIYEPLMAVRIGINPITWANDDDPRLGGDTTLETILSEAKQAGFAGTELGGKFPRLSDVLGPILKGHGLALVSGWYDGRILEKEIAAEYDAILPHLTLLRDLGAKVVVYADTSHGRHDGIFRPVSQRPKLDAADWPVYGRKITALADKFADFGVQMAFHHHMGTFVETDHEIDQLMAHSGESVGLLFDTGHCVYAKGDPAALLCRHIGRVNHVHCKDIRRAALERAWAQDMSFMGAVLEGIFTVPGDGSVDYLPLLRRLHDAGYAGWLVVEAEQDPAKAHPLTYAKMGYRYLKALAEQAGFTVST